MISSKPLGHKSYGSIGHLPGSRMDINHAKDGTGKKVGKDFGMTEGQARICTTKTRDRHDRIIVQEKLDGSNVAVANIDGMLVAVGRAGHLAASSPYMQHRLFANWLLHNANLFEFLSPGERVCGEWLAQAHGTRYSLPHGPFVAFDIMRNGHERATLDETRTRVGSLPMPDLLSDGPPITIEEALSRLNPATHGAIDPIEGCVWRVERHGKVDFLAKYVRPGKVDGCYLPEVSGGEPVWNWQPAATTHADAQAMLGEPRP